MFDNKNTGYVKLSRGSKLYIGLLTSLHDKAHQVQSIFNVSISMHFMAEWIY
jgi:hypothetical protein